MEAGKVNVLVTEVHSHSPGVRMAAVHTVVARPNPQAGQGVAQAEKVPHILQKKSQSLECEGATSVSHCTSGSHIGGFHVASSLARSYVIQRRAF